MRLTTHCHAAAAGVIAATLGCAPTVHPDFLGSAVIEAHTTQLTATVAGQILALYTDEGRAVNAGDTLAVVDTVPVVLLLGELDAGFAELKQQVAARYAEVEAGKSEVRGLKREMDRIRSLVEKGSAPQQQLDQLTTQYETAQFRLKSASSMIAALKAKTASLEAKRAQLLEQFRRCCVTAPCGGTVLTRYRSVGEMAGPTAPLFEIGSYDTVWADFFVPQPLLGSLKVNQDVRVRVDTWSDGSQGELFVPASIAWIADDAEFSPKNVQTRESRNELVFKVRARAANPERLLKRGLPVEIWR